MAQDSDAKTTLLERLRWSPMSRKQIHCWVRRIWIAGGIAFLLWLIWNVQAHGVSPTLLTSDERVQVGINDEALMFLPRPVRAGAAGLVFLPGGMVDPTAYVPLVRSIADAGFPAAIVRLPYRSAPTDGSRQQVRRRIARLREQWGDGRPVVLAGHSRGAALAARLVAENSSCADGLVLIATTHPRDRNMSSLSLPVVKITGTCDCVATPSASRANAARLPSSTRWIEIEGANHAQFGFYGSQLGDCRATISRNEQQRQVRAVLLDQLGALCDPR
jgi:pimeloyl-ACP methyl ester carboxylesterase